MALKKRKTPLTELFPEREMLRVKPIAKPKNPKKNDTTILNPNQRKAYLFC